LELNKCAIIFTCYRVSRTTVSSSRRWDVGFSSHVCRGHSHRLVTETSRQLDRCCGTVCVSNLKSVSKGVHLAYWRHFCLMETAVARSS